MMMPPRRAETQTPDPPGLPYLAYGGRLYPVPEGRLGLVVGGAPEAGADHGASDPETRLAVADPSYAVSRRNVQVLRIGQWLWARRIGAARAELLDQGRVVGEIGDGWPGMPLRNDQQIRLINRLTVDVLAKVGPDLREGAGLAVLAEAIVLCGPNARPGDIYQCYRALHNSTATDKTLQRHVGNLASTLEIEHRGTGRSRRMLGEIRARLLAQGRPMP